MIGKGTGSRVQVLGGAGVILFLFFALYSYLPLQTLSGDLIRFNSPDETANYYFSKLFAERSTFGFEESALASSKNFVHPRSMTVVIDEVKPVSFLGMTTLYGLLGKITGPHALLFVTPLLAVLTIPFFYRLVRTVFSRQTALFSSFLLLLHPAYWYYASRSMMNNVLFVDLCIIGFSLVVTGRRAVLKGAGAFFIGLALMVRFSEILWVGGLLALLLILCIRRVRLRDVAAIAIGVGIPIVLLLGMNNTVYGNPISFGYQTVDTSTAIRSLEHTQSILSDIRLTDLPAIVNDLKTAALSIAAYILPFGFTPDLFFQNFLDYGVSMFWWLVIPVCFGIVFAVMRGIVATVREKRLDNRLIWLVCMLGVAAWLVIFYGSWLFHDNITKNITIGNSYVRYWLPITVLALPFAAEMFSLLARHARTLGRGALFASLCGLIIFYSFRTTLWDGPESLTAVASELERYRAKAERMNEITPENAIIFSQRSDKIFFPDRRVAQVFDSFEELPLVPEIIKEYPTYYYGFWEQKDADYVSRRYFEPLGLSLVYVAQFDHNERLYKIEEK